MKFGQFVATQESLGVESMTDMELAQTNTEVAEASAVVIGEGDIIVKTDDAIEDALNAADRLGEATSVLSKDSGDLSPQIVTVMENLYSTIMTGLGMSGDRVTMESNGDNRSAWIATMESEREGIFAKIIAAIKGIINTAIGFLANLFKSKFMLEKFLKGLKARLETGGEFGGGAEITAGFPDKDSAIKALNNCSTNLSETQKVANISKELSAEIKKGANMDGTKISAMTANLDKLGEVVVSQGYAHGDVLEKKGDDVLKKENSPGKVANIRLFEIKKGDKSDKVKSLSSKECVAVIDSAISTLEQLKSLKNIDGALRTALGAIKDIAIAVHNERKIKADRDPNGEAVMKAAVHTTKLIVRCIARNYASVLSSLAFNNIKAAGDMVRASMRAGGAASAETSKDGDKKKAIQ